MRKPRVVLDSNIYISAVLYGGNPEEILEFARSKIIEVYISKPIIEEVLRTLGEKFGWSENQLAELEIELKEISKTVEIRDNSFVFKADPADKIILNCALAAKADYLVSGDKKHILTHKKIGKTKITSAKEFLRFLSGTKT
jgi:putative PIN family toxin of toxin-antitoxin system